MTRRDFIAVTAAIQSAANAQPGVGNHIPLVESLATSKPKLSWLEPRFTRLDAWKKEARARYLELLHYAPAKVDPRPEVLRKQQRDGFTLEHILFSTTSALRVPAFVLSPSMPAAAAQPGKRFPAIVALHDHGGFYMWGKEKLVHLDDEHPVLTRFKQTYLAGRSFAEDLARSGYVVIVIDMHYWGDRRMLQPNDPEDWRERPASLTEARINQFNQRSSAGEELMGRTITTAGATWPGILLWDDIRTVDYLLTRPDVDPRRIGCVGHSVGGLRACYLTAADPRVKAGVIANWMTSFPTQLKQKILSTIGHTKLIPGLYNFLDYPDLASLAMPAALLVINGGKDGLFEPAGVQAAYGKLRDCYRKAGIPERVQCSLYPDAPHEFNAIMQAEAWKWLARWV
jgi:dienelactone hydrolase